MIEEKRFQLIARRNYKKVIFDNPEIIGVK